MILFFLALKPYQG